MIIRRNRTQYVMVIQCQGSKLWFVIRRWQISSREGFIQFLNTLRFPIQLYVQTRTLNLKDIIEEYRSRMKRKTKWNRKIKNEIRPSKTNRKFRLNRKTEFEIRRKKNVFEYGMDISEYIARLA